MGATAIDLKQLLAAEPPGPARAWLDERLTVLRHERRRLAPGEPLVEETQPGSFFYRLERGVLAARKAVATKQPVIAFFYPRDLVLPGQPGSVWTMSVRATVGSEVDVFSFEDLKAACARDPSLGYGLFEITCCELSQRLEAVSGLKGASVEARFATFLLEAGRRLGVQSGRGVRVPLPMTRKEIASYLGLRTETLCRIIARWKAQGLIVPRERRVVEVPELADLTALAGDPAAHKVS